MKRLLPLICILAAGLSASAQINRIEYFWDSDPGFGNGSALPIAPGDSVNGVFIFSTTGLQPGLHTLYIRSRDAQGRWSVFSKKAIRIQQPIYPIQAAEYFYDTDPGFGNGTPLPFTPPLDSIVLAQSIPTAALAPGLHTLYVRVRDTNGKWSVFSKRAIHIQQPLYPIAAAEYFVDTDPGFGNGTPITITPGDSIDVVPSINTSSLTPGIHTVYIRVKSTNGEWSVFSKRLIHIQYPEAPQIVAAEYFVDTDPGIGNATPITLTAGDSVLADFSVPTGSLSLGIHMVYVRVKYHNDQWSVFSKKLIYIDNPADDPIVAAEYFIDTDPGLGNAIPITILPGDSVIAGFSAPTNTLLIGPHRLYVRVKDAENRWSVYSKDSFYVGNFNCAIYGNGGMQITGDTCRGIQLTFKDLTASNSGVNSNDYTREWDFFNDGSVDFTDSIVNYTFNQTGTYTVKLKVNEIANPFCQEVILKTITIRNIDTTLNNVSICQGESYFAGGANQTTSGTYYDTYSNRYGCDSVRITNLNVIQNLVPSVTISTPSDTVCSGVTTYFTAIPVNGGTPVYTWKVNGTIVGSGYDYQGYNPFGIATLAEGDTVTCEMQSSFTCANPATVTSNSLVMHVISSVAASITIDVDTNNFCSGTAATFTVTNVVNEGSNPQYNWYIDNFLAQSGGTTFTTSLLVNGNYVRCLLTSDAVCVSNSPVTSNAIPMTVFSSAFPALSINANLNSVCYGTVITFTASTSYGGNNPVYQWFLNDTLVQSSSSNQYFNDTLDDNDQVKCVLTSDYQCRLADTDTSNTVIMDIIYNLPVSVTLTPSGNNICEGTGVTFTASVTNGGSPVYQFFLNGTSVQNGPLYYYSSSTLNNNDSIWAVVTSDIPCASNTPATSDTVIMTVVKYDTVSISIIATDDSICEGTSVTFTANAVNPGASPTYLWRVNNAQVQSGSSNVYTSASLGNGSMVKCELYGDHQCVTPNPAVSNIITMTVTDTLLPSAHIAIPQTLICEGTNVSFTATLTNEGNNPSIEWLLNNNAVQTGGLSYSTAMLQNFDAVRVRLTSGYECPSANPVLSNIVVMTVLDSITPSVFVYHGPNPACPGSLISVFTTTSTGGSSPAYEFRKNGTIVQSGQQSQYTSSNFSDGDVMQVTMTSNASCLRTATAVSNPDTIRIQNFIAASVSIQITSQASCVGDTMTFEASTTTGGLNPIFTWRVNNVVFQSGGSNVFSSTALQNGDSVYCEMNSSLPCATNNPASSNIIAVQLTGCCLTDDDCNDNNLCTIDGCNSGTCIFRPKNCADNNACTQDSCFDGICVNPYLCNDGNACTVDACDTLDGCSHVNLICVDGDLCTTDGCNTLTGCTFTPVNCSDGNSCTNDVCDTLSGLCTHDTIQGCVNPCDTLVCFDNNLCTDDTCLNGNCTFPAKDCNDGDACTLDSCTAQAGCFRTPVNCNDGSVCTLDSCDSAAGCFYNSIPCDDENLCTTDTCNPLTGCVFIPVNCDDGNPCTGDLCDTLSGLCSHDTIQPCGNPCDTLICFDNNLCTDDTCFNNQCMFPAINCDDGDACTLDSCDSSNGCFYTTAPGCCQSAADCDDNEVCTIDKCNAVTHLCLPPIPISGCCHIDADCASDNDQCTQEACVNNQCSHPPVICEDGNLCTIDTCDTLLGCGSVPIVCADDGNPCTDDACVNGGCPYDSIQGCCQTTADCDDNNGCTTDACIGSICQNTVILNCCSTAADCNDSSLCTIDKCVAGACQNIPIPSCDDLDACTFDFCDPAAGCSHSPVNCDDFDACTADSCFSLSGCFSSTITCDDSSLCTSDGCNSVTGCVFIPVINCNDGNPCTNDTCNAQSGLCSYDTIQGCGNPCDTMTCSDNSLCTADTCLNGQCAYTAIDCSDGDVCTLDSCDRLSGCFYASLSCNDDNACTSDSCNPLSGCYFIPVNISDGDSCTIDGCDPLSGTFFVPVDCNDSNACTDDFCDPLSGCQNTPHDCNDNDACTDDTCDTLLGCQYASHSCDDNDACTDDTCHSASGCAFTLIDCNDSDSCTVDKCEFGVCVNVPVGCNDGDSCTLDSCVAGICVFIPISCADNNLCTDEGCDPASGCQYPPHNCDDGDACSDDFCDSLSGCFYFPHNCDDGNACSTESCDPLFGCIYPPVACDDNDACTTDTCDSLLGCVFSPVICNDNNLCTADACQGGVCVYQLSCDDNNACTMDTCLNDACQFIDERRILSFTLVDADNDTVIGLLTDGAVIDLYVTGPISIRADVCATSNIESVKFLLNGVFYKMENIPFYTIAGDNNGNYNPWIIAPGTYTIRAIPFNANNGTGIMGIYNEITITIVDNTPPCSANDRLVLGFTLVDAANDADIGPLNDGDTIDLSVTPAISVRANVCQESNIGSVKFLVNGSLFATENILFYTIAGDNGGNYNPWNVTPGVYTIRATPYSGNNGTGITGTYKEITIVIIDGTTPCGGNDRKVVDFTLVDAAADADIGPLNDGDTIDLSVTPAISVRANVCQESNIGSVKFLVNGSLFATENILFYTIAGDNGGNYNPWNVTPGVYTIRATPYSGNNGTGIAGAYKEITIVVIDGTSPCQSDEIRVTSFTLVSATSDTDIGPLADGAVIDLSVTGKINVRANIFCEDETESVRFRVNANNNFRTENVAPYALAGDAVGDYYPWNVSAGIYTIGATPYSGNNASGIAGIPLLITITVTGSAAKMDAGGQSLAVEAEDEVRPDAYPNPFSDKLNIEFILAEDSRAKLEILSITGQRLATLFDGYVKAAELQRFAYAPAVNCACIVIYRLQTEQGTYYGKAVMAR